MRDQKALEMARFVSKFQQQIQEKPVWNQNEILIMMREVLAQKARTVREEKEILEQQLALLKRQREPMFSKLKDIEMRADRTTRRALTSFLSVFVTQYIIVQYGTFVYFSWDIMEPITCGMTLGDAICSYFFWVWAKRPYTI